MSEIKKYIFRKAPSEVDFSNALITTWDTTKTGATSSTQIALPLANLPTDITVYWGDGNSDYISAYNQAEVTHTYSVGGVYEVKILGNVGNFDFNLGNIKDPKKLLNISQWGETVLAGLLFRRFFGCNNMTITATGTDVALGIGSGTTQVGEVFRACWLLTDIPGADTWDVSAISNFSGMFQDCKVFNQNIGGWTTTSATAMSNMFNGATIFNQNLNSWDVSSVTTMLAMFQSATAYNQPMNLWNVSSVTTFQNFLILCSNFNSSLSGWVLTSASTLQGMLSSCPQFNQDINNWTLKTTGTVNMQSMFANCTNYNQPMNLWNVSAVTNMSFMFQNCTNFNQDISGWTVSAVMTMHRMFQNADAFAQNISGWNVTSLSIMSEMFSLMNYNQPITGWTTTALTNLNATFESNTIFNQDVSLWNTSGVTNFFRFLKSATAFNQNLGGLNISAATNLGEFLQNVTMSTANYDATLIGFESQTVNSGLSFHGGSSNYTAGVVDSGTTDGTTANKLIDSTQNFLTTVSVGDVIHNSTDNTYARVTAIDSDTALSLDTDIMTSGEAYSIQGNAAAKARAALILDDGWTIVDGGPI